MKSLEWFRINVVSHDTTWESTSAPVFIVCGSTLHSSPWASLSILAHLRDGLTLGRLTDIMSRNAGKHYLIFHTILTCGPAPQELVQHQILSIKLKQLIYFSGLLK
jgi:hypothetical protein